VTTSFDSVNDRTIAGVSFDTSTTLSPAGTAADGRVFYGGWKVVRTQTETEANLYPRNRINNSDPDNVQTGANSANPSPGEYIYTAAYVWTKNVFQSGGDSQQVNLDSDGALSATADGGLFGSTNGQWIVQTSDSTWYVSNETFNPDGSTATSQGLLSTTWAPVDFDSAVDAPLGSYTNISLDDVQAVGFYLTGGPRNTQFSGFQFNATVIPEPSAGLLLGLGLMLLCLKRRGR
jgi:hypothetical protein